jgi:hypothetical protein
MALLEIHKPNRSDTSVYVSLKRIEASPQKDDPRDRVFGAKLPTCVYVLHKAIKEAFSIRVHPAEMIHHLDWK